MRNGEYGMTLQESGPVQEAAEGSALRQEKMEEAGCSDIVSMQHPTPRIPEAVRFHAPSQQRRAPWPQEVGPCEAQRHAGHAEPQHRKPVEPVGPV